ncbi:conserved hypothetical protein [Deferribacter desulfuricans SSM1]|uniref:MucB/RseB C-terminal domain-containing protein n=1 Tax=Deferribacter desulfuricans (strain DSM 14783 / JCM 11476 / NBRC 101012 / SSM1) TaxID=639282 RepID=D3PD56_DEFDS|nr:MucB/RseB C-terminal domain-containing protein [Deferribacter desulfuricans]BAI80529.1 conserved hypothetical protein [Deferribacter desulfuricans SSM1]
MIDKQVKNICLYFLFIFFVSVVLARAENLFEGVYIKIALDEDRYVQFDFEKETPHNKYLAHTVSNLINAVFSVDMVSSEYYSEKISYKKISDFNIKVIEFDPIFNDRFKHILWIYKDGRIYKQEVYDLSGKLLYSYQFKTNRVKKRIFNHKVSGGYYLYKGFKLVYKGVNRDGEKQISFTDGLNSFSVFWKKSNNKTVPIKRILLGNYMLRKNFGNYLVTVVGTIPYFEMEKVVNYLIKKEVIR